MQSQLGLTSIVGWRVRQAGDQGIAALVRELGDRSIAGRHAPPAALRALEAAVRLHREDVAAPGIAALIDSLATPGSIDVLVAGDPTQLASAIELLTAVAEELEGPGATGAVEVLAAVVAAVVSRISRIKRRADQAERNESNDDSYDRTDDGPDTGSDHRADDPSGGGPGGGSGGASESDDAQTAASYESQLVELIDAAPALARSIPALQLSDHQMARTRGAVRAVLQAVAGVDLHRVSLVGGNARRVATLLEAIALAASDPRRKHFARSAQELFDEIAHSRLYVSGAIAQQPHGDGQDIVRAFGATHIDGMTRPCTTLAWVRALIALRPIMADDDRHGEIDALLETLTHNALMVAVGTDPTRFFGPVPHGLDRAEELDLFGTPPNNHRFAPGPWRASMRSAGEHDQCCAASTLLALSLVPSIGVHVHAVTAAAAPSTKATRGSSATVVELAQLTPSETTGDGWELSVAGDFPFGGAIALTVRSDVSVTLKVRVPDWHATDDAVPSTRPVRELADEGELPPPCRWETVECDPGVTHREFEFPPVPRLVSPHPLLSDIRGCVALMAGPLLFCLEGADQMGHLQPRQVRFDVDGAVTMRREVDHPESHPTIHATGDWHTPWSRHAAPGRRAYRRWEALGLGLPVDITFVPYYSIANRGYWDVAIWLPLATAADAPS